MVKVALWVVLEAKPDKVAELEKFLISALPIVQKEHDTTAWFAIKINKTTFAIFDAFPNDAGRDAHLKGDVAKALMAKADELLAKPPSIQKIDVLADKLPK